MISILQIALGILILFFLSRTILRYKDNSIKTSEFIFWMFLWIIGILVIIFKDNLGIIENIGVQRPVDIILYASIILMFYLIFRLYVKIDEDEQRITILTREIAKQRARKK